MRNDSTEKKTKFKNRGSTHLAGKDISESGKSVVEHFVVDSLIQVLDENVSDAGFSEGGVALAPHDSDRLSFDLVKVHCVDGALGILGALEVYVGVAQTAACDHVSAHADRQDRSGLKIFLFGKVKKTQNSEPKHCDHS